MSQLTLEDAKKMDSDAEIGNEFREELPPFEFGRVAAQTAKQVITGKVREAERHRQYNDFKDRFSGESDYFANKGEQKGLLLDTNFVADAINLPLMAAKERGAGGGHIRFSMARGSMNSHISQFPVGTYKKAHAHGPGAHVIILSGEGYSLMAPEGEPSRQFDWQEGSMIVPPNMWMHQHFNTGSTPARYLAFKAEGVSIRNAQGVPKAWISRRVGGHQVDYADEPAQVREGFAAALARVGLEPRMDAAYQAELADLPPARA